MLPTQKIDLSPTLSRVNYNKVEWMHFVFKLFLRKTICSRDVIYTTHLDSYYHF